MLRQGGAMRTIRARGWTATGVWQVQILRKLSEHDERFSRIEGELREIRAHMAGPDGP